MVFRIIKYMFDLKKSSAVRIILKSIGKKDFSGTL